MPHVKSSDARGMERSLRQQQALQPALVGVRHERGLAEVPLPLGMLLGQDVALVRVIAAQPASSRQLDALPEGPLGFLFRHWFLYFGASTIDMLRPSSFGSCSILAMSFSSFATRSSTSRPKSR